MMVVSDSIWGPAMRYVFAAIAIILLAVAGIAGATAQSESPAGEVERYVYVDSVPSLDTEVGTWADIATVDVPIPSDWDSWDLTAHATYAVDQRHHGPLTLTVAVNGERGYTRPVDRPAGEWSGAFLDHVSGSGGGTQTVTLQANDANEGMGLYDIAFHVRAVRTG